MPVRVTTSDVLSRVQAALRTEAQAAAGNAVLSRAEQDSLPPSLLKDAAVAVRAQLGSGARVDVDALVVEATHQIEALLGGVNTRGPGAVSQAEVQALHAVNPDAGIRVARAYELITGKHIDLPGAPVVTPPVVTPPVVTPPVVTPPVVTPPGPTPARRAPITGFIQSPAPQLPNAGPTALRPDGSLQIVRGAMTPSTFSIDVGGRTFVATVALSTGQVSNVALPSDVAEAIRAAVAPAYDVRVTQHDSSGTVVELFAGKAPPPANGPLYVYGVGPRFQNRGALRFTLNQNAFLQPGESVSLRIDDTLYTAAATRRDTSVKTLVRQLRDQAVADGRTVDLREYSGYAPWTFIVTG